MRAAGPRTQAAKTLSATESRVEGARRVSEEERVRPPSLALPPTMWPHLTFWTFKGIVNRYVARLQNVLRPLPQPRLSDRGVLAALLFTTLT